MERWSGNGAGGVPGVSGAHGIEWALLLAPRCLVRVEPQGTRVEPCMNTCAIVFTRRCKLLISSLRAE